MRARLQMLDDLDTSRENTNEEPELIQPESVKVPQP